MKKIAIFLLLLIFSTSLSYASDVQVYSLSFKISQDMKVKEELKIVFSEPLNETVLNYLVLSDFSNMKINNTLQNLNYVVDVFENEYNIKFLVPKGTQQIYISFEPKTLIFSSGNVKEFFTSLQPPKQTKRVYVKLELPEGYAIYKDLIIPRSGEKTTDGKRIMISWTLDASDEIPIMVKFYNPTQTSQFFVIILVLAILATIPPIYLFLKNRAKENLFIGFSQDERKVIEILMKRKAIYQNKLEKELQFSRAKMTRIIKKLEERLLVEKEKCGRTNKIKWK